jgi:hypothetical protein
MARVADKKYVDPKDIYEYLTKEKGVSRNHALGIIANIKAESGFNASAIGDKGTSIGLFQHHGPRAASLKKFAGGDYTNWKKQVDFMYQEKDTQKYLSKNFETPTQASEDFTVNWERPTNKVEKAKKRSAHVPYFESRLIDSEITPMTTEQKPAETEEEVVDEVKPTEEKVLEGEESVAAELAKAAEQDEVENEKEEEEKDDTDLSEAKQLLSNKQAMIEELQQQLISQSEQQEEGEEGYEIDQIEMLPQVEYGETPKMFNTPLPTVAKIENQNMPQQEFQEEEIEEAKFGGQFKDGGVSEPPPLFDNIVYPQGDSEYQMRPYNMDIIHGIKKQRKIQQGIDSDNYIDPSLDRRYFMEAVRKDRLGDFSEASVVRQPIKIVI